MIASLLQKLKGAIRQPDCQSCRSPLQAEENAFCTRCVNRLSLREPYPLVRTKAFETHAAALFNPSLKKLLYSYKFYGQHHLAPALSTLLIRYWEQALDHTPALSVIPAENIAVVTVPSHQGKKGCLPPLASPFAEHFGYRFYPEGLLAWDRAVTPQHKILQKRGRLDNINQSMSVNTELLLPQPPELVLIVDDLTTTGATLFEATQAFNRSNGYEGKTLGLALCSMPLAFQKHLL